ncbi:AbrB/MazE/SpoVT family DNA-binding domain-containing protein [uncultured Amnibacterium sp.]|uniref:AbrB/MazE/SpoVT family DNA-binding domain-containing protein n=1 Tax=uncultured Amnibacterium sp. TaxID=1631851 RepID=UPI0035C97450
MDATVTLGQQGRFVIPAEVRAALGLHPGDQMHIRVDGRQLILGRPEDAVSRLRGFASEAAKGRSLVDELLAERRASAASE